MDIYIERENSEITDDEWMRYINTDNELILSENVVITAPLTKQKMEIIIPGRVLWHKNCKIFCNNGRIGCEGFYPRIIEKLSEIAAALSANVYDCGEKIV